MFKTREVAVVTKKLREKCRFLKEFFSKWLIWAKFRISLFFIIEVVCREALLPAKGDGASGSIHTHLNRGKFKNLCRGIDIGNFIS